MQVQRQTFNQEQRLKMNPQMLQSIQLMAMPLVELRERIGQELESNPALEVIEDKSVVSLDEFLAKSDTEDWFDSSSDSGIVRFGSEADSDKNRQFVEGVLTRPETLQERLLWQFRLLPLEAEDRALGEALIQNLDASGFHIEDPALLKPVLSDLRRNNIIGLIQGLDPQGCCVADYRESIRVQVELLPEKPAELLDLVSNYFDLMELGRVYEIVKKSPYSEEMVNNCLNVLKTLLPFPGRQFGHGEARYIVPDLQIVQREDELVILLNDEEIPVLGINPFFSKLLHGAEEGPNVQSFVRENIKDARWFIRTINQRNQTLLRVTRAIVNFQSGFFARGPKYLAPLTLKDIANEIGVHETTVSRVANGKYIQTEWGIFEIRHFFTNSISGSGSSGSKYSKEGVKEIIKEIISDETINYSDQSISDILAKRGISLARRTVAKYRNELALGSSYQRS